MRGVTLGWGLVGVLTLAGSAGCATTAAGAPPLRETRLYPEQLAAPSTPETHRRAAEEMLEALHMQRTLAAALETSIRTQLEANPSLRPFEPVLREFLGRHMSYESIRGDLLRLYIERFNELELRQLTSFYRTPLGARAIEEMPALMERGSQIGVARVREHARELEGMVQQYVREHPDAGRPAN